MSRTIETVYNFDIEQNAFLSDTLAFSLSEDFVNESGLEFRTDKNNNLIPYFNKYAGNNIVELGDAITGYTDRRHQATKLQFYTRFRNDGLNKICEAKYYPYEIIYGTQNKETILWRRELYPVKMKEICSDAFCVNIKKDRAENSSCASGERTKALIENYYANLIFARFLDFMFHNVGCFLPEVFETIRSRISSISCESSGIELEYRGDIQLIFNVLNGIIIYNNKNRVIDRFDIVENRFVKNANKYMPDIVHTYKNVILPILRYGKTK